MPYSGQPPFIYLDQNKWIQLAKAKYRSESPQEDVEVLRRLTEAALSGRARFPISQIHMIETAKRGSSESRRHLAELMAELSLGWVFASADLREENELDEALATLLGIAERPPTLIAFRQDLFWALGGAERFAKQFGLSLEAFDLLRSHLTPKEALRSYLEFDDESVRTPALSPLKSQTNDLAQRIQDRRSMLASETRETQDAVYRASLLAQKEAALNYSLIRLGRSYLDFAALPPECIRAVIDLVPSFHVEAELASQLERQGHAKTKPNDLGDIAFLRGAIPYCHVIVTEKHWVDLASRAGLPEKYCTSMISDIREIDRFLLP